MAKKNGTKNESPGNELNNEQQGAELNPTVSKNTTQESNPSVPTNENSPEETSASLSTQSSSIFQEENGHEVIDTYKIYCTNIKRIQYYLKKASYVNPPVMQNQPSYRQLGSLYTKIKNSTPFFQFLSDNLWLEELKVIQKVFHAYILNPQTPPKESAQVILIEEKIIELFQKSLIARPLILHILNKYKVHEKNLKKMLRENATDTPIEEPEE